MSSGIYKTGVLVATRNDTHYHPLDIATDSRSMTSITLRDIAIGESATITGFTQAHPQLRRKMLAMGLMPGTQVNVLRVAPLGDPIHIKLRGTSVSLRSLEAAILVVTPNSL